MDVVGSSFESIHSKTEDISPSDVVIEVNQPDAKVWFELSKQRKNPHLCDVILTGYDRNNILAHSKVLGEASNMLRDAIKEQSQEEQVTIHLPDLGSSVIKSMLNFLYLGKLCVAQKDIAELNLAATILKISSLEKICGILNGEDGNQAPEEENSGPMEIDSAAETDVQELIVNEGTDTESTHLLANTEPILLIPDVESTANSEGDTISDDIDNAVFNAENAQVSLHLVKPENDDEDLMIAEKIHESLINTGNEVGSEQIKILNESYEAEEAVQNIGVDGPGPKQSSQNINAKSNEFGLMTIEYEMQNKKKNKSDYVQTAYVKVARGMGKGAPLDPNEIKDIIMNGSVGTKGQDVSYERQPIDVYDCRIRGCKREFRSLSELRAHRRAKHAASDYQFECEICGRTFKYKHNVKHHMERHLDRVFGCTECNKSFYTRQDLLMHMRVHTGQKPFRCDFCNKTFSQGCNLLKHKRSVHNDEFMGGQRPHECPECLKCFKTQDMLHKHIKRHEQRLTCAMCNAEFRLRKDLVRHQKTVHNMAFMPAKEENSLDVFKCSTCEKNFLSLKRLTLHQETVHEKTKRYACPYPSCSYRAFYRYAIDRHFQKHAKAAENVTKRLICDHCGEKFTAKRDLITHIREKICREDEVPEHKKLYACVVCNTKFYSVSALQKHQDTSSCLKKSSTSRSGVHQIIIKDEFSKNEALIRKETDNSQNSSQPSIEDLETHASIEDLETHEVPLTVSDKQSDSTTELATSQDTTANETGSKKIFCHITPAKTNTSSIPSPSVIAEPKLKPIHKVVTLVPTPGKKAVRLVVVKGGKPLTNSPKVVVVKRKEDVKALLAGTTAT